MRFLINTTEVYRVGSEREAEDLINFAKNETISNLVKYNCEYKEKKSKGEVEDFWYKVTLIKQFTSEKEPDTCVEVNYSKEYNGISALPIEEEE